MCLRLLRRTTHTTRSHLAPFPGDLLARSNRGKYALNKLEKIESECEREMKIGNALTKFLNHYPILDLK
jgi:hypothetical protein